MDKEPYVMVEADTPQNLAIRVNQRIREGYVPYGEPYHYLFRGDPLFPKTNHCQAMILKAEPRPEGA